MGGKTTPFAERIQRLRRMDAALATAEGLHVPDFARAEGVSQRNVHRDLHLLRQIGVETRTERDPETGRYHHWSSGRLFAE